MTAIVSVSFTWLGSIFLRPIFRMFVRSRGGSNDVVGNVLSSFGVLYGILVGLTAVAAYQNWSTVDVNVTKEAGAMLTLHQEFSTYPAPLGGELRDLLRNLGRFEVKEEWAVLKKESYLPAPSRS